MMVENGPVDGQTDHWVRWAINVMDMVAHMPVSVWGWKFVTLIVSFPIADTVSRLYLNFLY